MSINGNALRLPLADHSVDLIVTSPPYFGLRKYAAPGIGEEPTPAEYVEALVAATREMIRVLKPSGSIFVNLGDKYTQGRTGIRESRSTSASINAQTLARMEDKYTPDGLEELRDDVMRDPVSRDAYDEATSQTKSLMGLPWRYAIRCIDQLGLILRRDIIWSKPNGLPESVTDRCRSSHEYWFHLTTQPCYYSAIDEIREPHIDTSAHAASRRTRTDVRLTVAGAGQTSTANPLGKPPGSVWTIPTEPLRLPDELGVEHHAAFPSEWPRRIILGWSPRGGTVLDPFGGTGTTASVAQTLSRIGISVDISHDYARAAVWRATDPKLAAKVLARGA